MTYDPTTEGLDDVASRLNQLIQICKDGDSGFRTSAETFRMTISGDFSEATLNSGPSWRRSYSWR